MPSTRLVVVIGATGLQEGSVVSTLLKNPSYSIKGVTRNISSTNAKSLASKGVEMVTADANDASTLIKAFEGAHIIFAITNFDELIHKFGPDEAQRLEFAQGKNIADIASSIPTLSHFVWSTLASASGVTDGKWSVPHFDAKGKIDEYIIHSLPALAAKTTLMWVPWYAENTTRPAFSPSKLSTASKYVWLLPCPPTTPVTTSGSVTANVGKFVAAILAQPHLTLPAKYVIASTETTTTGQMLEIWSAVTGNESQYVQISLEDYEALWPVWGLEVGGKYQFWNETRKGWTKEGVTAITGEELGVEGLVGMEEALREFHQKGLLIGDGTNSSYRRS